MRSDGAIENICEAEMTDEIAHRLAAVRSQIAQAAHAAGRRTDEIKLLAVSKYFSAHALRAAFAAGQSAFGESYLQEALVKIAALTDLNEQLEWHFIGPLQSNKTKLVATHFAWVHSVDRLKVAQRLSEQRPTELPPLNVCIQINISDEASKHGVPLEQAQTLAQAISQMPRLRLRGLMAIPAATSTLAAQRAPYRQLRHLFETLRTQGLALDTLSMGMSADLNAAVLEGTTLVRVGTAIFGQRSPSL